MYGRGYEIFRHKIDSDVFWVDIDKCWWGLSSIAKAWFALHFRVSNYVHHGKCRMTESQFQSKLRRALQARLPKAVIWKHNDRFTAGIPDLSVTHEGRTTWLELKVNQRAVTLLQQIMLKRVHGYTVRWYEKEHWDVEQMLEMPYANHGTLGRGFDLLIHHLVQLCR